MMDMSNKLLSKQMLESSQNAQIPELRRAPLKFFLQILKIMRNFAHCLFPVMARDQIPHSFLADLSGSEQDFQYLEHLGLRDLSPHVAIPAVNIR